jgi:hypothetical protein
MALGQILTIPNQQSQLVTTLSRESKGSLAILNPNDGVCYIKLNGPASNVISAWDWKLPSQSYGQFPGPWSSLGVYYLDQSGSGRTAELNVYESESQLPMPLIVAIGRAVQSAGTTMDITTGNQPQNPPANTARLWVDNNGNAYLLYSDGSMVHLTDTNDTLGGVLTGFLPNPGLATNSVDSSKIIDRSIQAIDIGTAVITANELADGAVTYNKLAANSVDTNKIADRSIAAIDIQSGTITNNELQAGTALANLAGGSIQYQIGQYFNFINNAYAAGTWFETVINVTGTFQGSLPVRVEWSLVVSNTVSGAIVTVGIGRDGALDWPFAQENIQVAGVLRTITGVMYYWSGVSAGSHRIGVFINSNTGTTTISNGNVSTLFVTEQRR